jgi:protein phosphatase
VAVSYRTSIPDLRLLQAGLTDIGCRRRKNEDASGFFASSGPSPTFLMVVADGVGGNLAGEVASQLAVETLRNSYFRQQDRCDPSGALLQAIVEANRRVFQEGMARPDRAGMATTCTAAVLMGQEVILGHVGDCRAYLVQEDQVRQLTADHSVAAEYERLGVPLPAEEEALAHVLTRWLGTDTDLEIDVSEPILLPPESTLVLCTDGLTKVVPPREIQRVVAGADLAAACRCLVDLARGQGGPDNITVLMARLSRK